MVAALWGDSPPFQSSLLKPKRTCVCSAAESKGGLRRAGRKEIEEGGLTHPQIAFSKPSPPGWLGSGFYFSPGWSIRQADP